MIALTISPRSLLIHNISPSSAEITAIKPCSSPHLPPPTPTIILLPSGVHTIPFILPPSLSVLHHILPFDADNTATLPLYSPTAILDPSGDHATLYTSVAYTFSSKPQSSSLCHSILPYYCKNTDPANR